MNALKGVECLRRHGRGKAHDPRLQQRRLIAGHQVFAKLGHMKKAAHVFAIPPDGEGYSPLFQTRTKVFGPVDRVDDCDPALKRRRGLGLECLFPDDPHAWQYALKEAGHLTLQKQIRIRHGASVRLPDNLMTERQKGRH